MHRRHHRRCRIKNSIEREHVKNVIDKYRYMSPERERERGRKIADRIRIQTCIREPDLYVFKSGKTVYGHACGGTDRADVIRN